MADYAMNVLHVAPSMIELEEQARTTWENIAFTLPQLRSATQIKIASNTFHARRARRYVLKQAPELGARLHRARDYKLGELAPVKLMLVIYEWRRAIREQRRRRAVAGHPE